MRFLKIMAVLGVLLASAYLTQLWRAMSQAPVVSVSVEAAERNRVVGVPKAQVEERRYSFGTLDVGESAEHWFTIRNTGTADLELTLGRTSCQCTLSELDKGKIPPGGEGRVRLQWEPPKPADLFAQGATIKTNDPDNASIYFSVVGQVRTHLAASPESVSLGDVARGETERSSFLVYSQAWEDFQLQMSMSRSDAPVSAEVEPADQAELDLHGAKSGHRVHVAVVGQGEKGHHHVSLKLKALVSTTAGSTSGERELDVPVYWIVTGPMQIVGPDLRNEVLRLGTVWLGEPKHHTLHILVRGDHDDLEIGRVEARPEFVSARLGPRQRISPQLAKYPLHIDVPQTAAPTAAVGRNRGEIHLTTNHPQVPEIRIPLELVTLEKPL